MYTGLIANRYAKALAAYAAPAARSGAPTTR